MEKRITENLPDGIKYADVYYFDENMDEVDNMDDAKKFICDSYDFDGNLVNEAFGYTQKYIDELKKINPELFEELDEEEEEDKNITSSSDKKSI